MKYDPADSYALSKFPVINRCKPAEWEKALISSIAASKRAIDYNDPKLDDFWHINERTNDSIYWTQAGTDEILLLVVKVILLKDMTEAQREKYE